MTEPLHAFPASFAQQRLWFLSRMAPSSPFYNIAVAIPVQARIDEQVMQRALNALVERHESLRTKFAVIEGELCQVICPPVPIDFPVVDLRFLSARQRKQRASALATEEALYLFDLESGPLIRCKLLRCGPLDNIVLLTLHHIISDGWSMGVLARELTALYQAFRVGRPSPLPDLPIQYVDFAIWQRERMQGEVLEEQLAYWKHKLADLPTLELPTDRPRPPELTFSGALHSVQLSQSLSDRVRSAARQCNATPFMVLLAAFGTLLHRYSGQDDVIVGAPMAGRSRPETEGLIGFFVNSLVLRIDAGGDPSFCELVSRVRETALEAYAHQDLPFEKLVEELQPLRDPSRNPMFQVTFQLVNAPIRDYGSDKPDRSPVEVQHRSAMFDLAFTLMDVSTGFRGVFEYSTDLFDAETVADMDRRFQHLLDAAIAAPDTRLSRLPLLNELDWTALLALAAGPGLEVPSPFVLDEIRRQADRTPDVVAVRSAETELTYRQLRSGWHRLAHHLVALGVEPETRVGVCMDRSADMVTAFLAILEAGGSYLPLDPGYPRERLRFMMGDSKAAVVLTQAKHAGPGGALEGCAARLVPIDAEEAEIARRTDAPGPGATGSESLAYVIYTSGSTGRPKGVAIPHRAIANHMQWMLSGFPLGASDRVLQRTSSSFDASVWEFLAPLMAGAQLVMLPVEAEKNPPAIIRTIAVNGVTVLQVVPALLRLLLNEPTFYTCCASLRRVFCGGEALSEDVRVGLLDTLGVELVNLYGPTESTIDATAFLCTDRPAPLGVPIGRPIANMRAHVLDRNLAPVAAGLDGELYIGGPGLARGYIDQPGLTADRFLPDPFATPPGARLYRTGDRVRRLADGNLLFLGRTDQQVKVRGYRIEPSEIEATIRQVQGVRDCVVIANGAGTALTAFVVPGLDYTAADDVASAVACAGQQVELWEQLHDQADSGKAIDQPVTFNAVGRNRPLVPAPCQSVPAPPICTDLQGWSLADNPLPASFVRRLVPRIRETLGNSLPEHMIPSPIILLDALPLLPNGKLDRSALPANVGLRPGMESGGYVAPRTAIEEALAIVWAQTLGLDRVGILDGFFSELDGHSLLATRLIARIRASLRVDVPLKQIFTSPTVESFALALLDCPEPQRTSIERTAELFLKLSRMSEQELDQTFADQLTIDS